MKENRSENQIVWFPSTRFQLFTICVVCKLRATKIILAQQTKNEEQTENVNYYMLLKFYASKQIVPRAPCGGEGGLKRGRASRPDLGQISELFYMRCALIILVSSLTLCNLNFALKLRATPEILQ